MRFSTVLAAATFVASALAQRLALTQLPPPEVKVGEKVTLKWAGGEKDQPVTITLQKGPSRDLKTVSIITGDAEGGSFDWTPSKELVNGDDYALKISQGVDDVNYSGQFTISGGSSTSASASSSASSATITATSTLVSGNSTSLATTTFVSTTAPLGTGASTSRNATFSSQTLSSTATNSESTSPSTTSSRPSASSGAASPLEAQAAFGLGALAAALFIL